MKRKHKIFLSVLVLLFSGTLAWFFFLRPPSEAEITAALDATIIPKLTLRDVPYADAVAVVLQQVRREHPSLERVHFHTYCSRGSTLPSPGNPYSDGKVTLHFTAIPANEALRYIAIASNLGYTLRDGSIYFYTLGGGGPPATSRERLLSTGNRIAWRIRELLSD